LRSACRALFVFQQGEIARQNMFDAEKLSAARWAVRDILQYLKNNRRVKRTSVEKAVRRLNEAGFEDSASMLEAEFRPVFQGKKITTELSSSIQSLYDGVDAAISLRMNARAATELKPDELPHQKRISGDKATQQGVPSNVETAPLKTASTTDIGSNSSTKQAKQTEAPPPVEGHPPSKPESDPSRPTKGKRGTERGEGREKLIAALTEHHKYADGSSLNQEPVGNNELARAAGVSGSTASVFFAKEFGGLKKYKAICSDERRLITALKLLNQEFSPHVLFGDNPPEEAVNPGYKGDRRRKQRVSESGRDSD